VTSLSRAWATALAYRLTNSTLELEKEVLNKERQEEIIQPNSGKSFLVERKASAVNLESVLKSTLSNCISLNHCTVECSAKASPTSTETIQGYVIVLARTNVPSAPRTQIPIPVRLTWEEKAASMLHLYLPATGGCHVIRCCWEVEVVVGWWFDLDARTSGALASCQSASMFLARSTTMALVSITSSHTLRLRCFHILHNTDDRRCVNSTDKVSNR